MPRMVRALLAPRQAELAEQCVEAGLVGLRGACYAPRRAAVTKRGSPPRQWSCESAPSGCGLVGLHIEAARQPLIRFPRPA